MPKESERCCTRPSLTEANNLFCESHTIFWLILLPKAQETSIGPIRKTLSVDPAISNFEIDMGRQKFKMCKSLQIGARRLRNKAATFRPAYLQHAGSNYPHGLLRVAQAVFQRTRVLCGYQIFGAHHFIQKLYEIRVSKDKLPTLLFQP